MAISQDYRRCLTHFGNTCCVRDLNASPHRENMLALRHDVDHNLDTALEFAFHEQRAGCRASYYILHDAAYMDDPRLFDKCLQLQDFGHEVGLHLNLLTLWYRGKIDDIGQELEKWLAQFRKAGVKISGVAAHGDPLCYEGQFTNYWLFEELRPENPALSESHVRAEGIQTAPDQRCISYPRKGHTLQRPDGREFPFWSLKLADFSLDYEASRLDIDDYFSDSGGRWLNGRDPRGQSLSSGRTLVLMHPEHWRGPQQHYYFLSTARSGSKWLARFLHEATSVEARHEFTLNHRFENRQPIAEKRTGAGFTSLLDNRHEAARLINSARAWSEEQPSDYAEANIYLEQFFDLLPREENTHFIHLHREPQKVVRSLWQRGWYEVPFDDRHPPVKIGGWAHMDQFEQICHYVRDVNNRLADQSDASLPFEKMTSDFDFLQRFLTDLDIAVYPRLAAPLFGRPENITRKWTVPAFEDWNASQRSVFDTVFRTPASRPDTNQEAGNPGQNRKACGDRDDQLPQFTRLSTLADLQIPGAISARHCTAKPFDAQPEIHFSGSRNAHLLLGAGFWHPANELPEDLLSSLAPDQARLLTGGWRNNAQQVYALDLSGQFVNETGNLRVICLSFDEHGRQLASRQIAGLAPGASRFSMYFRPVRDAASFNLALLWQTGQPATHFLIKHFQLLALKEQRRAMLPPGQLMARARGQKDRPGRSDYPPAPVSLPDLSKLAGRKIPSWGCKLSKRGEQFIATPLSPDRPCHILLAGGTWHRADKPPVTQRPSTVPPPEPLKIPASGQAIQGMVEALPQQNNSLLSLFVLLYDDSGRLVRKYRAGVFSDSQETVHFRLPAPDGISSFNLAIHAGPGCGDIVFTRAHAVQTIA